jgi:hypothetical protein
VETPAVPLYSERLRVPLVWWLIPVFDLVVLGLGTHAYRGPVVAAVIATISTAAVVAGLLTYGALDLRVDPDGFRAGRHVLPTAALGTAWPLEPDQAWALRGPRADARATVVLRGYIRPAVRVDVTDGSVPYWYVSTRRPLELAAALNRVREARSASGPA